MTHPGEKEIQEFLFDPERISGETAAHLQSCPQCREAMESYRILSAGLNKMPVSKFEFNITELVMARLPDRTVNPVAEKFVFAFLIFFASCFVAIPAYLFRQYVLNLFSGIPPFFIYSITLSAILAASYKSIDMYRKFRKQMRELNFS
jgi:hypothetical protein